jgi:YHS domain-containing protein
MRFKLSLALAACAVVAMAHTGRAEDAVKVKCIVSGADVTVGKDTPSVGINGTKAYFCCMNCPKAFMADPEKFVKSAGMCPINKNGAAKVSKESRVIVNNDLYYMCCANCPKAFSGNPAKFAKLIDPVSGKEVGAAPVMHTHEGQLYVFSGAETKAAFEKEPAKYVKKFK